MKVSGSSRLFVAVTLVMLTTLACDRSTATVTPVTPLPTLAPPTRSPSPTSPPAVTASHTPTPPVPVQPTDTPIPLPSPTATPVIPLACPPAGDPTPPDRPTSFDDYPAMLAAYLSGGASAQKLEQLLRDWGAITDETGKVRSLDITGDMNPEVVVAVVDPMPEFDLPWPPGDVLIFQCKAGAVVPTYQGRQAIGEEPGDLQFSLEKVEDVNSTGRADVVYITSSCGAHTCMDRLYIVEWDGAGFVNRIPDIDYFPHATFTVEEGRVVVDAGGIGSAGAGYQRSYQEIWAWDGRQFSLIEQNIGPPTALVHYIHDGDEALAQGDYGEAIGHYQRALEDTSLPIGLFLETEEQAAAVLKAYARFKMLVAYAASGDGRRAQSQYDTLLTEHPGGSPGTPYLLLAQAFWSDFVANESPSSACAAAVTIAESNPTLAEQLYAGYANPEYEAADLCRVGD